MTSTAGRSRDETPLRDPARTQLNLRLNDLVSSCLFSAHAHAFCSGGGLVLFVPDGTGSLVVLDDI